ncbi:MAG: glycosyl hydrolase-related protein [bacterium]
MARNLTAKEKESMKCTIHVLPNTHWDREWRFSFQETRIHLLSLVDRLLDIMENNPGYQYFNFDSQTIFLDDYLELKPENRGRLEELIRARRLLVGPWHTLPEMNVIHGESIVRNLLMGKSIGDEFGCTCKVGYTPTSYGQVSQIAQIYTEFGIDGMIFYRGLHDVECGNEYILEAPDGSRILGIRLSPNVGRGAFYLYIERPTMIPDGWHNYKWEDGCLPFHLCRLDSDHEEEPRLLDAPFTKTWNPNPIRDGVQAAMSEALQAATCPVFCLFDGMDSTGPCDNLPRIIGECNKVNPNWRFVLSSLPDYLADLKSKVDRTRLTVLKGERRRPSHDKAFNAFLKDSMSSRMYLKIRNAEVERALMQWAEPFSAIASGLGMEYPAAALRHAWKQALANHSHDAIGGLSPDQIHKDMMGRFDQAFLIGEALTKKSLGVITSGIDTSSADPGDVMITVFNPSPQQRSDVVECFIDIPMEKPGEDYRAFSIEGPDGKPVAHETLGREQSYLIATEKSFLPMTFPTWKWQAAFEAANVPPMGFSTFRVRREPWPRKHNQGTLTTTTNTMENEFLRVRIEPNGTLTATDKQTGEIYKNVNFFEAAGECGDPWWRWAPPSERVCNTLGLQAEIAKEADGPVMTTYSIRWKWMLPEGVTGNKMARASEEKELTITSHVSLKKGVPRVDVRTVVNNTVRDHRLRMMAEAGFKPETSFSHTQFDVVERGVRLQDTSNWLEPWTGTNPVNGCHGTSSDRRGLAVLSFGLTEYEVIDDETGTTAATLLRTYQYPKMSGLFREDRVKRTGNEGSQMLGEQTFRYAFCFFKGSWAKAGLLKQMTAFRNPLVPAQHGRSKGGQFGRTHSFFSLSPEELCLTAIKKAEKGNNIIVRFYNPTDQQLKGRFWSYRKIKKARQSRLDEKRGRALEVDGDGHEITLTVPKKKIITLELAI